MTKINVKETSVTLLSPDDVLEQGRLYVYHYKKEEGCNFGNFCARLSFSNTKVKVRDLQEYVGGEDSFEVYRQNERFAPMTWEELIRSLLGLVIYTVIVVGITLLIN